MGFGGCPLAVSTWLCSRGCSSLLGQHDPGIWAGGAGAAGDVPHLGADGSGLGAGVRVLQRAGECWDQPLTPGIPAGSGSEGCALLLAGLGCLLPAWRGSASLLGQEGEKSSSFLNTPEGREIKLLSPGCGMCSWGSVLATAASLPLTWFCCHVSRAGFGSARAQKEQSAELQVTLDPKLEPPSPGCSKLPRWVYYSCLGLVMVYSGGGCEARLPLEEHFGFLPWEGRKNLPWA